MLDVCGGSLTQALAFTLGGIFVLLQVRALVAFSTGQNWLRTLVTDSWARGSLRAQYLSSRSLISINWEALTGSYDRLITSRVGPPASKGGNRLGSLWSWFIDFVGANVQSRATFVAGVLLGFRLG